MKKYLFILKSELMSNLQYVANFLIGFVTFVVMIYIFLNLWQYVYADPNQVINGYTMTQMVWYVCITEILWMSLGGRRFCIKIVNDVRSGNIAYNLNKPYNYILYSLFSHLGFSLVKYIVYVILGLLLGFILLGSFPALSFIGVITVLITGILATIVSTLLITFIGLFSFIIEDSNPFYWLYSKLILIIGTLFPIEYFPAVLQPILKFSPIYVVSYGPAKLFVDFSVSTALEVIISQVIYIFIGYFICSLLYKKGAKRLNVNGG